MEILIQSRSRAHRQRTWAELPDALRTMTRIVVYEREAAAYRAAGYEQLWAVPDALERLGPKRQYILEHAEDDHLVLLDDDLGFLRRRAPDDWRLRSAAGAELVELFQHIDQLLDSYAHVGVSMREGNNRLPTPLVHNQRYCRLLAYRRSVVKGCDFVRSLGLEDFDVNLQLLASGHPSAIVTDWAQGQGATNDPGGCSDYRTHAVHAASVEKLAELWPDFVRVRDKENKSGGEFGHRKEVTISWKKAFESSQKA